jgi:hypothetical protein
VLWLQWIMAGAVSGFIGAAGANLLPAEIASTFSPLEAVKNVTVYRIRTPYTPKQGLFRLSALGSRKPAHFLQPLS